MSYAPARTLEAPSAPRLGLRARLRAAREARMVSAHALYVPAHRGDLRAAALLALGALDAHGAGG
jgi:hypothetical protein